MMEKGEYVMTSRKVANRNHFFVLPLIAFVAAIAVSLVNRATFAQTRPEVTKTDGHYSPLSIKVVYPSGQTKVVLLLGVGAPNQGTYFTHIIKTVGADTENITIWLDTL